MTGDITALFPATRVRPMLAFSLSCPAGKGTPGPAGGLRGPVTFIKWITCSVGGSDRGRFDTAQRCWSQIAGQPGLIVQAGGWDRAGHAACVLACWTGAESYRDFMKRRHDQVAADSGQAGTYQAIEVATGESELTMPGAARTLAAAAAGGAFLRVADCQVRPGRREHFASAQRQTWIPGMAAADGMLGGLFSRISEQRYLVTTWWSSAGAHDRYAEEDVPGLRRAAGAGDDLASLRGYGVELEPGWLVLPGRTLRPA